LREGGRAREEVVCHRGQGGADVREATTCCKCNSLHARQPPPAVREERRCKHASWAHMSCAVQAQHPWVGGWPHQHPPSSTCSRMDCDRPQGRQGRAGWHGCGCSWRWPSHSWCTSTRCVSCAGRWWYRYARKPSGGRAAAAAGSAVYARLQAVQPSCINAGQKGASWATGWPAAHQMEKQQPSCRTSVSICSASAPPMPSSSRSWSSSGKLGGISVYLRCSLYSATSCGAAARSRGRGQMSWRRCGARWGLGCGLGCSPRHAGRPAAVWQRGSCRTGAPGTHGGRPGCSYWASAV